MNKNGTLKTKLEKAKKWAETKKQKKEKENTLVVNTEEDLEKIADIQKRIRAMRRG